MDSEKELKWAILIDADNISDKYIKIILDETSKSGIATYKRIYGDWTNPQLASWKKVLLENSIIPMQQYSYTTGKSATDSAMIIDAMDILYSRTVDGFCIVSSDSDFTRLAARLREAGMQVIGMGESKTPKPFISACNQFKYLDILLNQQNAGSKAAEKKQNSREKAEKEPQNAKQAKDEPEPQNNLKIIKQELLTIVDDCSDDDGWALSSVIGDQLAKRFPDFDVRNFGCSKFTQFMNNLGLFEMKRSASGVVYFKIKESPKKQAL